MDTTTTFKILSNKKGGNKIYLKIVTKNDNLTQMFK